MHAFARLGSLAMYSNSHYFNLKIYLSYPMAVFVALTHRGRVTHVCVGNLTIIGSDNGLSPGRRRAITWTNVGILLIGPLGTNFSEMLIEIHTFSFKKIHWKMAAILSRPQCVNSLRQNDTNIITIIGSGNGLPPFRHQVIIWTNISMSKTISFQSQCVNGSCCYFWNGAVMYLWV